MKDTISEEDLLIDVTKTELEKRLIATEKDNQLLKEKMAVMETKFAEIKELVDVTLIKARQR